MQLSDPALKGLHGFVLDGVTIADANNKDLGKCQSSVLKAYEKLFATTVKEFGRCVKAALKNGAASTQPTLDDCLRDGRWRIGGDFGGWHRL